MDKDIYRKIKKLRTKLEKAIGEKGLNSTEVRKFSDEMDELLNEYEESVKIADFPKDSEMLECYKISYEKLKKITSDFKKFPTVAEWNQYAKENDLLSNSSLEYISKLNWKYLKIKVERELNFKIIEKPKKVKKNFWLKY